jgi:uncharacterized protein YndB with AHSA1/START domain
VTDPETKTVVVERDFPHPPEKLWRALTQSHLISEWLMKTDFAPVVGHRFGFSADWGGVRCEVLEIEPQTRLSYSWGDEHLKSVIVWTLEPVASGTRLRMEQTGFRPDQPRYFQGAQWGWPRFFDNLESTLAALEGGTQ